MNGLLSDDLLFIFVFQFFIKHVIAGFTRPLEQFPDFIFGFLHTDIICRFARIIRFGFNKKALLSTYTAIFTI